MPRSVREARPKTEGISPFFIVGEVERTIAFYCDQLGSEIRFKEPALAPFSAIVGRDEAQILVKSDENATPLPNCKIHPFMRWDAYVYTSDPDTLAAEFVARDVSFSAQLADTDDGLRGFEIRDPDGYVLFFGRPIHEMCAPRARAFSGANSASSRDVH
jgi:catechol 2,3-dioxygenase-like lactoylglutathione lyase family enzyme